MNERIKFLFRQAERFALEKANNRESHDEFIYEDDWAEKFAELIVKECIKQIENSFHADPYTGETYDNIVNSVLTGQIDNLKEHFGVE